MRKRDLSILILLLVTAFIGLSSCEQSTNPELTDSLQSINAVTPIEGAQNVTMNLKKEDALDSFFTVSLNGGHEVEGWCIEWNEEASFGLNKGTKLHSTKGMADWSELNYFMTIKDDLKASDPELSYREIQVIIWSLIDKPSFDVDKIGEYKNISERIYKDGQPQFNVQKVKDVVLQITNKRDKVASVTTGVTLIENNGQTIMVGDETAFAVKTKMPNTSTTVDGNYSTCFDEEIIPNVSFNRWGWTNGPISEGTGEYTFDIYAGAGQCDLQKGTPVGELTVKYMDGTFKATYKMTEMSDYTGKTYTMSETHLYVGNNPYPQKGPRYTVAPGQYGNKQDHNGITEYTYEVNELSGDVYFIAHAVVSGFNP